MMNEISDLLQCLRRIAINGVKQPTFPCAGSFGLKPRNAVEQKLPDDLARHGLSTASCASLSARASSQPAALQDVRIIDHNQRIRRHDRVFQS